MERHSDVNSKIGAANSFFLKIILGVCSSNIGVSIFLWNIINIGIAQSEMKQDVTAARSFTIYI